MSLLPFAFVSILFLSGCGVDTNGWPHIEVDFSSQEVVKATIDYQRTKNEYADYLADTLVLDAQNAFEKLISIVTAYPIKEEIETSVETSNFASKISVDFVLDETHAGKSEQMVFYEYGISDGKVMLNNGEVHFLPGRIDYIYENMKG